MSCDRDISYIVCPVQAQGTRTYAGRHNSGAYHHFTGKERLDVHLLKPSHLEVVHKQLQDICNTNIADQAHWIDNRQVCPCYMTLPATRDCPVYTSAQWQMYWGEPHSSPASSTATPTRLFPTNSGIADSWDQHPPIPSRIAGTAADCTRWISGCGATDGASPGRCPSRRQRLPGRIVSARQEKGQRRQRNAAGRRRPEGVQRRRNENKCYLWYHIWHHDMTSVHDIIVGVMMSPPYYDIIILHMISCLFLWYHTTYDIIC